MHLKLSLLILLVGAVLVILFLLFKRKNSSQKPDEQLQAQVLVTHTKPYHLCVSQRGIELIKKLEGYSPTPYTCSAGKTTIGYGHVLNSLEQYTKISFTEAEDLLRRDITIAEQAIAKHVTIPLGQGQLDALVSFIFNIGINNFTKSSLLKKLNANLLDEASRELLKWTFVTKNGKKIFSKGLKNRRKVELEVWHA